MIWKPQEKELTYYEAVELARKELASFWIASAPLIAAIKEKTKWSVFTIDEDFNKKSWLLVLVDPTTFISESIISHIKEWNRRYSAHQFGVMVILPAVYSYLSHSRQNLQSYFDKQQLSFPLVIDANGGLYEAFGGHPQQAKLQLFKINQRFFEYTGLEIIAKTEIDIQAYLRSTDAGLPLLPIFQSSKSIFNDTLRIEFGFQPSTGTEAPYIEKGFIPQKDGTRQGQFLSLRPRSLLPNQVFISGRWIQDREKIVTQDSTAVVGFHSPSSRMSLVAQAWGDSTEICKIAVEINGTTAPEVLGGSHFRVDEQGQATVIVGEPQLYHILVNLPADKREISLRFPNASTHPVALYGIRFGEIQE